MPMRFQGIGERSVTRGGGSVVNRLARVTPSHQTAGIDGQPVVVQAHMYRARAGVVAMLNRIGSSFTGRDIHPRHQDAEQAHLQLSLGLATRTEVGFQPIQRFQQRIAAEFVRRISSRSNT
ncbi:MAG: hypothetical protein R3F44_17150 [Candidatus Competibacteraceae bacterium]